MKQNIKAERITYGVVLLLALGAFWMARSFPRAEDAHSGPGSFPLALSIVLGVLAFIGFYQVWKSSAAQVDETGDAEDTTSAGEGRRVLLLGGLTALYLVVMPYTGFISATAVFGMLSLMALGFRNPVQALASGFIAAYVLYWVFGILMNVSLPKGWIG